MASLQEAPVKKSAALCEMLKLAKEMPVVSVGSAAAAKPVKGITLRSDATPPASAPASAASKQNSTNVSMKNTTMKVMSLGPTKQWSGQVSGTFPITIQAGNNPITSFTYIAALNDSCQAAMVYTGKNNAGTDCGWLVAWYAPTNTAAGPNRVYAECGPKDKYSHTAIDWDPIRDKLMAAGTYINTTDQVTKATVEAEIDPATGAAALGVTFGANA